MPYIITTYPQDQEPAVALEYGTGRRRAVTTLDEARTAAYQAAGDIIGWDDDSLDANEILYAAAHLPADGDTIGPLPDGAVIEVQRIGWRVIAAMVDEPWPQADRPHVFGRLIDAYNEAPA